MIQFEVDYLGEPGFSVPSNDITSGIYLNDRLIKKYERPEKDFPGLCIVKEGLKAGESAIFEVTGLFGKGDGYAEGTIKVILTGTGELVTVDDLYYKNGLYNVGDPKPAVKAINNLKIDETYSVKELGWSWAYDSASYHIATGGVVSQTLVNPGMTPEAVKAAWTTASTSSPSEKNQYFIIRDGITLCFRFANTPKTSQPLHGESIKTNTFEKGNMEGGGSGEGGDI